MTHWHRRGWMVLLGLGVLTGLCGCAEDVPITTEPGRMHDELSHTLRSGPPAPFTVLLSLEASERAAASEAAIAFVRELVTGDSDGDGIADHAAKPHVSVAVVTPGWVEGFFANECGAPAPCSVIPPVADYEWFPYGFAPASTAPFLDQVRCLLSDDPTRCADHITSELRPSFLTVTAADLATKSYAELLDFGGSIDFGPWSPPMDRVLFRNDGRVQCTLRETLPSSGPITRCDQLSDFGRTFDHVDTDGHDVCEIQQLPPDFGNATPDGYGFYYYEGDDYPPDLSLVPRALPYPELGFDCSCGVFYPFGHPHLLMKLNTPFVPQATIDLRCALDSSE